MSGFQFDIFESALGTDIGLAGTLLAVILTGITVVAITRNTKHMRLLAFPIALGYNQIGLEIHAVMMVILALVYVITIVGIHEIGNTVQSIGGTVVETVRGVRRRTAEQIYREQFGADYFGKAIKLREKGFGEEEIQRYLGAKAAERKETLEQKKFMRDMSKTKIARELEAIDERMELSRELAKLERDRRTLSDREFRKKYVESGRERNIVYSQQQQEERDRRNLSDREFRKIYGNAAKARDKTYSQQQQKERTRRNKAENKSRMLRKNYEQKTLEQRRKTDAAMLNLQSQRNAIFSGKLIRTAGMVWNENPEQQRKILYRRRRD